MRIKVVARYLGLVLTILGLFMMVPLAWSLIRGESCAAAFAITYFISIIIGISLWRLIKPPQGTLSHREAIFLVAASWIMVSFFGALPYVFAGTFDTLIDAWFESVSGFTTSGASVMTNIEINPEGILLWRSFTQWIGGMGIITLFVALFPLLGIGSTHLVEAEMSGPQAERLTPRIQDTAKSIWILYLGFTILEVILLLCGGIPVLDAITISFSTMATGGFAPKNASVAAYNSPYIEGIIIIFMIISAINFNLYYFVFFKRQFRNFFKDSELRLYISMIFVSCVIVILNLVLTNTLPLGEAIRHGIFNSVSVVSTTGFATINYDVWPELSRGIFLVLILIGGSVGSTAGGIKVIRFLVITKYIKRLLKLSINPNLVIPIKVGDSVISENILAKIISLGILYVITAISGTLILNAMGIDLVTSFSAIIANMATTGPGLGLVGPVANYGWIPAGGKITITIAMLAGRLELFTIFALVVPSFWKWR